MRKHCQTILHIYVQMIIILVFLLGNSLLLMAQEEASVKGSVVSDVDGMPLIGVNVIQKGTTNGAITDIDGKFVLAVPVNGTIEISYIGYITQEIKVISGTNVYNIRLIENSQSLDEVVVMGYGVQKKKLVTGATVQVKGDDIQRLNTVNALGALQSQTPGVNITQSSGMPGEGFKVTIRGLGTTGNSSPLYIIDGVVGGDINNLNPSDIESIDVLKDAASATIYGSRAANGVILITTKQGKVGKASISYDGYLGMQNVYKMAPVLNAQEYMMVQNEGRRMDGNEPFDFASMLPNYNKIMSGEWNGTNWLEAAENKNAPVQNHALNITGGTDQAVYSLGLSYTDQEGVLGKPVYPHFQRYTFRVNTEYKLLKNRDFDVIKLGENLTFTYKQKTGIAIGNIWSSDIHNMLCADPLMPLYDSGGDYYDQKDKEREGWNWDSQAANPIGMMYNTHGQNISKEKNLRGNIYLEIQPIRHLKFRTSFGLNTSSKAGRKYIPVYNFSITRFTTEDEVSQSIETGDSWIWENTLSYSFNVKNKHAFDVMLGQSAEKSGMGESMSGSNKGSLFSDFEHAYLSNVPVIDPSKTGLGGSPWAMGRLASFFGRINYNYKETYMATVVLRADGSSNFLRGNRWGYFPSVSAGWVMTNERFMESSRSWMDFLKLRASWGQNGNADISPFQYLATISFADVGYFFGADKSYKWSGAYPDILPNKDVTWETSEQLDLGFDARFLNSRLGISFDYYNKITKNWLVQAPILDSYGANAPYINGGDVRNRGAELALNWNDNVGDFSYGMNFNVSYNKNEVTRIANAEGIIHGANNILFNAASEMYRAQVGHSMGYFYGYETLGVFQNETEIADYKGAKLEGVRPGDLIFSDTNGDGTIDEKDRCEIGNPNPDFNLGLGVNFGYKGFDLSFTATSVLGNQIVRAYRDFADTPKHNYTRDILERWHGEGTSNRLPRLTGGTNASWQWVSDIYVENGDYFRLQNVTLGYDFKKLFPTMPLQQARLYVAAQNLFTVTGYSGMDPEVGYGDDKSWASGIDVGFYPSPRTFLIGVNLKF